MQSPGKPDPAGPPNGSAEEEGSSRRTYLASERTQLAWWRTGLTAIAVAPDRLLAALTVAGIVLGALTVVLVIAG